MYFYAVVASMDNFHAWKSPTSQLVDNFGTWLKINNIDVKNMPPKDFEKMQAEYVKDPLKEIPNKPQTNPSVAQTIIDNFSEN